MATPKGQTVDLSSLTAAQLSSVKKQLDEELEHLSSSFGQLRNAQSRFRDCIKSIEGGISPKVGGKSILVPLTNTLYVPGKLSDTENVIVDVGTGFYIEKSTKDAGAFYEDKVNGLGSNLKDLESIIQGKANNIRVVEDVLRQKVINNTSASTAA